MPRRPLSIIVVLCSFIAPWAHVSVASAAELPRLEPTMAYQWAEFQRTADGSETTGRGLATIGLVSGDERQVTDGDPNPDRSVSWSPDGRSLLFARGDWQQPDLNAITVRDVSTGDETVLAAGDGPTWSPDGRRIAYVHFSPSAPSAAELVIVGVEKVDASWRLAPASEVRVAIPGLQSVSWSPFGDRLAFAVRRDGDGGWSDCDLWTVGADGTDLRRLTDGLAVSPDVPHWSPSGTYLSFTVNDRTWFMTGDGRDQHPAASESYDYGGSWSPVADVFALSAHGASEIALASPTAGVIASIEPEHQRGIFNIAWMPSGTHLVFSGEEHPSQFGSPWYLWMVPVAGGEARRMSDTPVTGFGSPAMSPGFVVRSFGPTRLETAVALSRSAFTTANDVVLAPAASAASALIGAPLAGKLGGPLLLTDGTSLEPDVLRELRRLSAKAVWLLGDSTAISRSIEDALREGGRTVHRLDASSPEQLSASVAQLVPSSSAYAVHLDAASTGWADAVSVSALAAKQHRPILLVGYDSVPRATTDAIDREHITDLTVIGGTAIVSGATTRKLEASGLRVSRLAGRDRYETSAVVADRSLAAGLSSDRTLLATGRSWPDSLTAGPAAAASGRVLLLVDGTSPRHHTATNTWLESRADRIDEVDIAGGAAAINLNVEGALEALLPI